MKSAVSLSFLLAATGTLLACLSFGTDPCVAQDAVVQLLPADSEAIAAREKSLAASGPEGAKLVAYLDCGTQQKSTTTEQVTITGVPAKAYKFPSEAEGVLPTHPTVFYDESRVVFNVAGLDRSRHYLAGLVWWDYDSGGRTQAVIAGAPDGRLVRLAVPGIGLPSFIDAGQPPAERRFHLPMAFVRDGQMRITVQLVTGPNVVISELWIWQLD